MSRGFVPTPSHIVDLMVTRLFKHRLPTSADWLLDPGCGTGILIDAVFSWCARRALSAPNIIGIELDATRAQYCAQRFAHLPSVSILNEDFLSSTPPGHFDFILGSPPYVPITALTDREKMRYRKRYRVAKGRFDLYMLFFEQSLRLLKINGRLCFITPEKFLYVSTCAELRTLLWQYNVEELMFLDESTYAPLITYPLLTTLSSAAPSGPIRVELRDSRIVSLTPPKHGDSVLPLLSGLDNANAGGLTLGDVCARISCGVATGADNIFIKRSADITDELKPFAHPTIAGRDLRLQDPAICPIESLLTPYSRTGALLDPEELGALGDYLSKRKLRAALKRRFCARYKPWYAFHDPAPLDQILKPKILCKDLSSEPEFWLDNDGSIVPRHSVYYLIPKNPSVLSELFAYLKTPVAKAWLRANCQRAAHGFIRLQSNVLSRLPVPNSIA